MQNPLLVPFQNLRPSSSECVSVDFLTKRSRLCSANNIEPYRILWGKGDPTESIVIDTMFHDDGSYIEFEYDRDGFFFKLFGEGEFVRLPKLDTTLSQVICLLVGDLIVMRVNENSIEEFGWNPKEIGVYFKNRIMFAVVHHLLP